MLQENNFEQKFKVINIIYLALGAGMLLSLVMFVFMIESGVAQVVDESIADILKIVVVVIAISGYGAGKFLYGMNAKKSKVETNVITKLNNYQTACLIVWAMLEGPGLFACIAYFMTGDKLFLAFFSMIFMGYVLSKPSVSKFQQDF